MVCSGLNGARGALTQRSKTSFDCMVLYCDGAPKALWQLSGQDGTTDNMKKKIKLG